MPRATAEHHWLELVPGESDVRHLAPGVYFIRRQDTGESGRLVLVE
ncbi:MAG: hypothetical protein R6X14_01535 [bacterium]